MQVLASSGANASTESEDGTTLLQAALQGRRRTEVGIVVDEAETERLLLEGVTLALDLGANINLADKDGNTPLHTAASRRLNSIVQLLVERGAKLDVENKNGQTPVALVSSPNAASTAELLKKLGATQ